MKRILFLAVVSLFIAATVSAQQNVKEKYVKLKKRDRKRDIELTTTEGTIVLRLYDSTPLHRDNFLRLVKSKYYDGVLFHRVIKNFMIQAGDPNSKNAAPGVALGNGGPDYKVPAEFRPTLFHKKGVLAAARDNNPEKASSGSQFYITQGKTFSDAGLDSLENGRLAGRKIPAEQREIYKTIGGVPHLDQGYTVYGEVIKGLETVDVIAATETSKSPPDRPVKDIRIIKARLIKRR